MYILTSCLAIALYRYMYNVLRVLVLRCVYLRRAKRAKCEERYRRKNQYEQGMWNVNTVLMGGLGGDPDSAGSSGEEGNILLNMSACT